MKELKELAYKLAKQHGYKYTRDSRFLFLTYSEKLVIGNYIRFIIETEY